LFRAGMLGARDPGVGHTMPGGAPRNFVPGDPTSLTHAEGLCPRRRAGTAEVRGSIKTGHR
ncbi:MAG: hypothetical protein LBK59_12190, partial [Bifidobacteriaceae bacterium]|nr:hypothetical protein [Bifidobacteriaceae bacterium]